MLRWFGRKKKDAPSQLAPVQFTPAARQQVLDLLQRQPAPAALRIMVKNPGAREAGYDMALEALDAARSTDTLLDSDGVPVLVDQDSLALVAGAFVDFAA